MRKILLCCSAGVSTSILMKKMIDWYDDNDIDVRVKAFGIAEVKAEIPNYDIVLLAPQMSYAYNELVEFTDKPVKKIPPEHYQSGNAEFVAQLALED